MNSHHEKKGKKRLYNFKLSDQDKNQECLWCDNHDCMNAVLKKQEKENTIHKLILKKKILDMKMLSMLIESVLIMS